MMSEALAMGFVADGKLIRKKLKITQAELALAFGIGKVGVSWYERGETRTPVPLVKLLKLIDWHPDLLEEMQNMLRVLNFSSKSENKL